MQLSALGTATTFSGRAARYFAECDPSIVLGAYHPSMAALWSALYENATDAIVLSALSTHGGIGASLRTIFGLAIKPYVSMEAVMPYRCSLFARSETQLEDISLVLGHGSLRQCRGFLEEHLPEAEVRVLEDRSSSYAAEIVLQSEEHFAVVSTPEAGQAFGLVQVAEDIDNGAQALWWGLSRTPRYAKYPRRIYVVARFSETGDLETLLADLNSIGGGVCAVFSHPSGEGLFVYDYLVMVDLIGLGLSSVQRVLQRHPHVHLLGAMDEGEVPIIDV